MERKSLSNEEVAFLYHHIIFPPKLPGHHDADRTKELALLRFVRQQANIYFGLVHDRSKPAWNKIVKMLGTWEKIYAHGALSSSELLDALKGMEENDFICLDISAQNAGLFLKKGPTDVVIGCYEVSSTNSAVMKTVALRRTFPSRAVALPDTLLQDKRFLSELVTALAQLDVEQVDAIMPKTKRAGGFTIEERETTNPILVTDLIMGILFAHGAPAIIPRIVKRIRDTVSWNQSKIPWRRLPLWTTIRVSLQLCLVNADATTGELEYKHFIIFLVLAIAGISLDHGWSSNTLFILNAKLAQRVAKLGPLAFEFLKSPIERRMTEIRSLLDDRWKGVQRENSIQLSKFSPFNLSNDTTLRLENSRNYLCSTKNKTLLRSMASAHFRCGPTRLVTGLNELPSPRLLDSLTDTDVFALADFETWVRDGLPIWQEKAEHSITACEQLGELITKYNTRADAIYNGHAEHLSIKFLTIMELWCALDSRVCHMQALLLEYGPKIPVNFLTSLLLPKRSDMRRLRAIEVHIKNRHQNAVFQSCAFFSPMSATSFAVHFYDRHVETRELRSKIEVEANKAREKKQQEWQQKMNRYDTCTREANALAHFEYLTPYGFPQHTSANCRKCILLNESASLRIQKHEWPLPSDEISLKTVVFELMCPFEIGVWRDTTWMIVQDLGRKHTPAEPNLDYKLELEKCDFLRPYFSANRAAHFTLATSTKPFYVTHYWMSKFPVTLPDILVGSSLSFHPYDKLRRIWVLAQKSPLEIHKDCIRNLPSGPYLDSGLQETVNSTSHTPNQIISRQTSCSKGLSTEEFLAFGLLRSGDRLQWMNILRELGSGGIRLNSRATDILVCQAAWQVGIPLSSHNDLRVAHEIFLDLVFCSRLLEVLEDCYCQVEANWSQIDAMRVILHVVLRVLSLASQDSIVARGLILLRNVRFTLHAWLRKLLRLRLEPENHVKPHDILETSLLCQETFNVEKNFVDEAFSESEDATIFVACAISLGEFLPNCDREKIHAGNEISRGELIRYMKLCHSLESKLLSLSEKRPHDISNGIRTKWENASYITIWKSKRGGWIRGNTTTTPSQVADFNLCSGELLIDGRPIKRLPDSFTNHPLYRHLFGCQSFDVSVSDIPSMEYMVTAKIHGRILYFSMNHGDLVVRCSHDKDLFEAVPPDKFIGDVSQSLIDGHSHWLNLSTLDVTFCSGISLWEDPSEQRWELLYSPTCSILKRGSKYLIDPSSDTFKRIVAPFEPLEAAPYLEVTYSETEKFEVNIPRYKLHFFLNPDGQFESSELQAVIDTDQDLGTLFGLKNKLILREAQGQKRRVLIPYGEVKTSMLVHHVSVEVNTQPQKLPFRYFLYEVDPYLRQLRGAGDLVSEIYKLYLHALTSSVLPDPFTGWTGTEECLTGLTQAGSMNCEALEPEVVSLLNLISGLTPCRKYYPVHLKSMELVYWKKQLPLWIQGENYEAFSQKLVAHNNKFRGLFDDSTLVELDSRGDSHLLLRSRTRNRFVSRLTKDEETGEIQTGIYASRDRGDADFNTTRWVSGLFKTWPSRHTVPENIYDTLAKFKAVSFGSPFDVKSYSELLSFPLDSQWGSLFEVCLRSSREDAFRLTFLFAPLILGQPAYREHWENLVACALLADPAIIDISPPSGTYEVSLTNKPSKEVIERQIHKSVRPESVRHDAAANASASDIQAQTDLVIRTIMMSWPSAEMHLPSKNLVRSINVKWLRFRLSNIYASWYRTFVVREYLGKVQGVLNDRKGLRFILPELQSSNEPETVSCHTRSEAYSLECLFALNQDKIDITHPTLQPALMDMTPATSDKLQHILGKLVLSGNETRRMYGNMLVSSLEDLKQAGSLYDNKGGEPTQTKEGLRALTETCQRNLMECSQYLSSALDSVDFAGRCLQKSDLWPRITDRSLLQQLSLFSQQTLPEVWKKAIIAYGICLTRVQRVHRILHYANIRDHASFKREYDNFGLQNQSYLTHPDWILMEVENNLLIRPRQARIAEEMINPTSKKNSLLQFNMGEGKSSVIIPMASSSLANGQRLVRVVVLKPLAKQMQQILTRRLGGMINRRVYFIPVSRKMTLSPTNVGRLSSLFKDCMKTGGILLCQPDHILSLKLIGIDRLGTGDVEVGKALMLTQKWLRCHARDLLDESDEILSTTFELVYTIGAQQMVDGQPLRWKMVQSVLDLVKSHAYAVHRSSPSAFEWCQTRPEAFPRIRILKDSATRELVTLLIADIMSGKHDGVSLNRFSETDCSAIHDFITDAKCQANTLRRIRVLFQGTSLFPSLIILRGLFAFNIIQIMLKEKRWLVNYGLDPSRTLMAVPFRAKGVPSHSSEFAHPDVAIVLTCLSYYYTGLTDAQITEAFRLLEAESDPSVEYHMWHTVTEMTEELRSLKGVNFNDTDLCTQRLFPHLRYNKPVIDFFLSKVVFPKEAVEFPYKLSTSAWDIPDDTEAPTTGFSGTSDNCFLLPLSIKQENLPEFKHTNALVLQTLLRPENNTCLLAADQEGKALSVLALLTLISNQKPKVRVLIDVGAQVLELGNAEVARAWLVLAQDTHAAVFFSDNDELMVVDREGVTEFLALSGFRDRLGQCCVYLDEAHTRGTDLQLPKDYRAAVTLGPHLTKDRFAQACMRLRKLGGDQSIICLAPPEIYRKIQSVVKKPDNVTLDAEDVLQWTLEETCQAIERLQPLWLQRGFGHSRRRLAYHDFLDGKTLDLAVSDKVALNKFLGNTREVEAKTLEAMYLTKELNSGQPSHTFSDQEVEHDQVISNLIDTWKKTKDHAGCDLRLQEEQEREAICEMEQQKEVLKIPQAEPRAHSVTPGLQEFINSGSAPLGVFLRAFDSLNRCTSGDSLRQFGQDSDLYVTQDFARTVHLIFGSSMDPYLRPVNWILSSNIPDKKELVIISPFEGNKVLPTLRRSGKVTLHIFTPKVTKSMRAFDNLDFYNIPSNSQKKLSSHELMLLRLFAGQLYLPSTEAYQEACQYLGVISGKETKPRGEKIKITVDGYVYSASREKMGWGKCPFTNNPLPAVNALLNARRRGQDFSKSHMGQIVQGKVLSSKEFEDSSK